MWGSGLRVSRSKPFPLIRVKVEDKFERLFFGSPIKVQGSGINDMSRMFSRLFEVVCSLYKTAPSAR